MIAQKDWKWFGLPGHFCGAHQCVHHLCTLVGKYVVSTVGDYKPYPDKPAVEVGSDRKYETYVFKVKPNCFCSCGCGMPGIILSQIDSLPANTHQDADKNHMVLCMKWAKKQ